METLVAHFVTEVELGIPLDLDDTYQVFNRSVRVMKEDGAVLAVFLKGVLKDPELIRIGRELKRFKVVTRSRGMAAGLNKDGMRINKRGNTYGLGSANPVHSTVVGFQEGNNIYKCRLTKFYRMHRNVFTTEVMQLLDFLAEHFREEVPKRYDNQYSFTRSINPNMRLGDTPFTTVTVNVDFRTFTHRDKGDFPSGIGNLMVFNSGDFSGAELMLPEFKMAFQMEEGDVMLFDVHEVHCNNAIKGKGRISMVCYAREGIKRCDGVSEEELLANSSVYWGSFKDRKRKPDYRKMRKAELQQKCVERKLDDTGLKNALIERLRADDDKKNGTTPPKKPKDVGLNYGWWKKATLEELCKKRRIDHKGLKKELVERLREYDAKQFEKRKGEASHFL
jgi:hypothetical protein